MIKENRSLVFVIYSVNIYLYISHLLFLNLTQDSTAARSFKVATRTFEPTVDTAGVAG
jgi:hypothetical protein